MALFAKVSVRDVNNFIIEFSIISLGTVERGTPPLPARSLCSHALPPPPPLLKNPGYATVIECIMRVQALKTLDRNGKRVIARGGGGHFHY